MAFLKKSAPAQAFRVPTLADASPEYAALIEKQAAIQAEQTTLAAERRELEKQIAADTAPEVRPAIAELLGDAPGTKALNRKRVAEIVARERDIAAALDVLRGRIGEARTKASRLVCEQIKPEYARRVAAMCKAMEGLDAAHRDYDRLRHDLEAEDVAWLSLIPMAPQFLGASHEPGRRIMTYIDEARKAGYYNA
ncbi:hypothetical protein KEU06_13755 [Pseudaminobacter sp. 19-2017]|uniref:Uncharacterized protein n=1 Tax=Pseudaminobacter soli (ex Zhang et al. 2022) TaxID=2831468 RepID=A0A942E1X3_9HYPH|nr:hypothetical protein [Pseudaminobacter soli]MBS3649673.1 hypothetical protein [Pseudaminobacter soli]